MSDGQERNVLGLKMMGACAVGLLLSLGLCGASAYLGTNIKGAQQALATFGRLLSVASGLGFLVGMVIAILNAISDASDTGQAISIWFGKTGLAKLATVFAIGFVISLGLCGINFFAATGGAFRGSVGADVIAVSAYLEVAGMALCAIGLLIIGLIALAQTVYRRFHSSQNPPKEDQ